MSQIAGSLNRYPAEKLDKICAHFRIALMGAVEEPEAKAEDHSDLLAASVKLALERGWTLDETEAGQLLLVPPPTYGEPPSAA